MTGPSLFLVTCTGLSLLGTRVDQPKPTFVDLSPHANHKLEDGVGLEGNDFGNLKRGEQKLEGMAFKIGDALIQLNSPTMQEVEKKTKPEKVEGIKVNKTFAKLHILQATEYGTGNLSANGKMDGGPLFIADDTPIAEYKLHYADGTTETIPVVYGKDVRDWWFNGKSPGVSRGKVVWKGDNELTKTKKYQIRLYAMTWTNPHPNKKVISIDFSRVGKSVAAPFCVAITMEE
jgi:hypothetical protein